MKTKAILVTIFSLSLALPVFAGGKKHAQRAMIEQMEAVPCGATEKGVSGIGSVFASIGATKMSTTERLCPQYMLRTDDMEYHIRPLDKHPKLLPVGQEGEFKISKNVLEMKIPDGDHKKRHYQVVAMKPIDHSDTSAQGVRMKYNAPQPNLNNKPITDRPLNDKPVAQKVPPTPPNSN
jgi:hypothetical protein